MNITILLCNITKSPERFSTDYDTTKYDPHFRFFAVHSAKDTRIWGVAKPDSDTLARLYGLVRGCPEVIGTQLPVIRAQ